MIGGYSVRVKSHRESMFFIFKTKPFTQSNAKQQFQANSFFKFRPDLDNSNSPNVTFKSGGQLLPCSWHKSTSKIFLGAYDIPHIR